MSDTYGDLGQEYGADPADWQAAEALGRPASVSTVLDAAEDPGVCGAPATLDYLAGRTCQYEAGHTGAHGAIVGGQWPTWPADCPDCGHPVHTGGCPAASIASAAGCDCSQPLPTCDVCGETADGLGLDDYDVDLGAHRSCLEDEDPDLAEHLAGQHDAEAVPGCQCCDALMSDDAEAPSMDVTPAWRAHLDARHLRIPGAVPEDPPLPCIMCGIG